MNLAISNGNDLAVDHFVPSLSMITGLSGMGKSTAAATWPKPVAFAFDENGLRYLTVRDGDEEYQLPRIEAPSNAKYSMDKNRVRLLTEFIRSQIDQLAADKAATFKTVIVDTVDDMYNLFRDAFVWDKGIAEFIPKDHTTPVSRDIVFPILQAFFGLVNAGYHVVLIAHTAEKDAEVGNLPVYKLLLPERLQVDIINRVDQGFFMIAGEAILSSTTKSQPYAEQVKPNINYFLCKATGRHPSKDRSRRMPKLIPSTFNAVNAVFAGAEPFEYLPIIDEVKSKMIRTKGAAYWQGRKK